MARSSQVFSNNLVMSLWSHDIDEIVEAVRFWDLESTQLRPGTVSGQLCQIQMEGLQVIYTQMGCTVRTRGNAPPNTIAFGIAKNRVGRTVWQGHEFHYDQVIVNTNREVDLKTPDDYEQFVLTVDKTLLFEIADNCYRRNLAKELRQKSVLDSDPVALERLRKMLTALFEANLGQGVSLAGVEVPGQAAERLIAGLIEAIPAPEDAQQQKLRPFKRTRLAKRVEAYMLDHLDVPLSLQDLCEVAGTSERSLHYAFHDLFDMSPMAYLKAHRLNQVRRRLKVSPPNSNRVIDIAKQWGFNHMGHFSVDYKAMFGESPSVTLRRFAG
ncbi:MAG: helix-turn-helix domain-containing protein [Cyanobacteria bacterium P01_A01_bin.123]